MDIDRYIDTPIDNFIDKNTSLVLPICNNIDFSRDFILSHPKSEILGKAISNNIKNRNLGKSLIFLAVNSYKLSVSEGISKTGTVFIFIPICFNDPATKFVFNLTASKAFSLLYSYKSPNDLADKVLGNSL